MSSLNKVQLIGRLGKDPEIKHTNSGLKICNISVATSSYKKNDDGSKGEKTEWHRIVAFDKLADIMAEYLTKGKQVYIEGRLQTREYQDKGGVKRYITEVIADQMIMLGNKTDSQGNQYHEPARDDIQHANDPLPKTEKKKKTDDIDAMPEITGASDDIPF